MTPGVAAVERVHATAAEEHTQLRPGDIDHLHRIAGDWQLLSDLSFADLLLWVPVDGDGTFLCVAQVRPTTAPTAYLDDQVGRIVGGPEVAHLEVAHRQGRIWQEGDPVWYGDVPARHEAIPVRLRSADGRPARSSRWSAGTPTSPPPGRPASWS